MIPSPYNTVGKDDSDPLYDIASKPGLVGEEFADANRFTDDEQADKDFADGIRADAIRGDPELLSIVQQMSTMTTLEQVARTAWERSYRAYRSEHSVGSKYLGKEFVNRSKVFRPKIRTAVRKNQAAAAQSLFSTMDPIKITAQDEDNPTEQASAAIKQEIVNYRLARAATFRNGVPWFLVAMGAHQDAQITGICCSKQSWRFKETTLPSVETIDEATGERLAPPPQKKIEFDRPDVMNIPPENVRIDSGAEWTNPAQTASRLAVMFPMSVDDAYDMISTNAKNSATKWRDVSKGELESAAAITYQAQAASVRRAREGGVDRQDETSGAVRNVWLIENFVRFDGLDYVFWSIGTSRIISDPRPTADVYPAFGGDRPIVVGYGALEAHRILPTSSVEALFPIQWELNDMVNLRLDQMKELVRPTRKVLRGKNVDVQQLQHGGNSGIIYLQGVDDVTWDRPPDVPASAYQEANYLNADFDSLAGAFDTGTVQTNRKLNETVGGMKMMAGSAGIITQFDLRVWSETWVEPVIRQIVKLVEHYESDETVLALAGNKANLFQKFGISEITDHLLQMEVTTRVDLGTGSGTPDPMERLQKFKVAMETAGEFLMPFLEKGMLKDDVTPRAGEILDFCFAAVDIRDGAKRFFEISPKGPAQPPPPDPKTEVEGAKVAAQAKKNETDAQLKAAEITSKTQIEEAKLADKAAERESRERQAELDHRRDLHLQRDAHHHETRETQTDRLLGLLTASRTRADEAFHKNEDRKVASRARPDRP